MVNLCTRTAHHTPPLSGSPFRYDRLCLTDISRRKCYNLTAKIGIRTPGHRNIPEEVIHMMHFIEPGSHLHAYQASKRSLIGNVSETNLCRERSPKEHL